MAMIDNTLAAQVPQFNLATTLQQGAQAQAMQQAAQEAKLRADQNAVGAEMRGLAPFANSPDFAQRWQSTMDGLLQKGVIDQNAHDQWARSPSALMMKSIIAKTDTPEIALRKDEDAQAQKNTQFSQGIQSQQLQLAKRAADRADDPTPDGFELNPAAKTDPNAPKYRPLSGGPLDPSYLASVAKAKGDVPTIIGAGSSVIIPNKASEGPLFTNKPAGSEIDDETADFLARRSLQGDTRALVGLGRGAQGAENILKIQQRASALAKEQGMDATDVLNNIAVQAGRTSEARTLGTKSANFGVAEKSMEESLPIALAASKEVLRSSFPMLNKLIQAGETHIGDPKLKQFLIATDTAAKDYARTINPSGQTREGDIAYARKLISTADGPEAYEAALQQLKVEAGITKRAIQRQKDELKNNGKAGSSKTGNHADPLGIR